MSIPETHDSAECPGCKVGYPCRVARRGASVYWDNYRKQPDVWGPILARDTLEDLAMQPPPAAPARPRPAPPPPAPPAGPEPEVDEDTYVTTAMLVADTYRLLAKVPADVDAVCAISRSGLLPGGLIAYERHVPLFTVNPEEGVQFPGYGNRMIGVDWSAPKHVLLVDDTVALGGAMRANYPDVAARFPEARITRAVVYAHPAGRDAVDLCAATYAGQHFLEWNWPNAGHGAACAYDFDGILCPDFTREQCADMLSYRSAMAAMPPRFLPRRMPVPLIASARPESCRDLTEAWLGRWGVRCERLELWPGDPHPPGPEVAPWKARLYAGSRCSLFAESDPEQARTIHDLTGRPVLCPALGRVLQRRGGATLGA